jgi:peptidoglycan/LPS O-acetylase OafA/YrhL
VTAALALHRADQPVGTPSGWRPDIEGLRAVAVVLVLLYHAGLPTLSGGFVGVDVFFVLSGYLITTLLVKELLTTGSIDLPGFYARRAKRLLPAAGLLLGAVAVLTYALLPKTRWPDVGQDLVGSAFYVVNWVKAEQAVDYLAQQDAPSPLQHFWSLAVEEQYYVLWPLLLLVLTVTSRPRQRGERGLLRGRDRSGTRTVWSGLLLAVALILVPSLLWSSYLTAENPGRAYFVTTTRVWELAIGAGLAVLALRNVIKIPRPLALVLTWGGLVAVIGAALVIDEGTPYPGTAALLPTLATAAVIAGGPFAGGGGAVALLSVKPLQWLGRISYSAYLWHWPLLVLVGARLGPLSVLEGLLVVGLSLVPAYLSFRYVEDPVRRAESLLPTSNALHMGVCCTLLAGLCGMGLLLGSGSTLRETSTAFAPYQAVERTGPDSATTPAYGSQVLGTDPAASPQGVAVDIVAEIRPEPQRARTDLHKVHANGCVVDDSSSEAKRCIVASGDPDRLVLVVGDSHAAQWLPALEPLAAEHDWQLATYLKASCPFNLSDVGEQRRCPEWNQNVQRALAEERPLMVITSSSFSYAFSGDGPDPARTGKRQAWASLLERGVPVIALDDTPRPAFDVRDCVAQNPRNLVRCATARAEALPQRGSEAPTVQGLANAHAVNLNAAICPADPCAAVIGGVLVYRDNNHLTGTYARSLSERLESELLRIVPRAAA